MAKRANTCKHFYEFDFRFVGTTLAASGSRTCDFHLRFFRQSIGPDGHDPSPCLRPSACTSSRSPSRTPVFTDSLNRLVALYDVKYVFVFSLHHAVARDDQRSVSTPEMMRVLTNWPGRNPVPSGRASRAISAPVFGSTAGLTKRRLAVSPGSRSVICKYVGLLLRLDLRGFLGGTLHRHNQPLEVDDLGDNRIQVHGLAGLNVDAGNDTVER